MLPEQVLSTIQGYHDLIGKDLFFFDGKEIKKSQLSFDDGYHFAGRKWGIGELYQILDKSFLDRDMCMNAVKEQLNLQIQTGNETRGKIVSELSVVQANLDRVDEKITELRSILETI